MEHVTAKMSSFIRGYHYEENAYPVFEDSLAKTLLGEEYEQVADHMKAELGFFLPGFSGAPEAGLRQVMDKIIAACVVGRSAFCEKKLKNEIMLGCRQYLVFGAGFDTFSFRNAEEKLTVWEFDRASLFKEKLARAEKAGLPIRLHAVPCDLGEISWQKQLLETEFDIDKKTFASMLGLCYYLTRKEYRMLLYTLCALVPGGSAICFDYPTVSGREGVAKPRQLAEGAGERMKAEYTYEEMEEMLADSGFLIYEHLDPDEMTEQYFKDYNAHEPEHAMRAPEGVAYLLAVKK